MIPKEVPSSLPFHPIPTYLLINLRFILPVIFGMSMEIGKSIGWFILYVIFLPFLGTKEQHQYAFALCFFHNTNEYYVTQHQFIGFSSFFVTAA